MKNSITIQQDPPYGNQVLTCSFFIPPKIIALGNSPDQIICRDLASIPNDEWNTFKKQLEGVYSSKNTCFTLSEKDTYTMLRNGSLPEDPFSILDCFFLIFIQQHAENTGDKIQELDAILIKCIEKNPENNIDLLERFSSGANPAEYCYLELIALFYMEGSLSIDAANQLFSKAKPLTRNQKIACQELVLKALFLAVLKASTCTIAAEAYNKAVTLVQNILAYYGQVIDLDKSWEFTGISLGGDDNSNAANTIRFTFSQLLNQEVTFGAAKISVDAAICNSFRSHNERALAEQQIQSAPVPVDRTAELWKLLIILSEIIPKDDLTTPKKQPGNTSGKAPEEKEWAETIDKIEELLNCENVALELQHTIKNKFKPGDASFTIFDLIYNIFYKEHKKAAITFLKKRLHRVLLEYFNNGAHKFVDLTLATAISHKDRWIDFTPIKIMAELISSSKIDMTLVEAIISHATRSTVEDIENDAKLAIVSIIQDCNNSKNKNPKFLENKTAFIKKILAFYGKNFYIDQYRIVIEHMQTGKKHRIPVEKFLSEGFKILDQEYHAQPEILQTIKKYNQSTESTEKKEDKTKELWQLLYQLANPELQETSKYDTDITFKYFASPQTIFASRIQSLEDKEWQRLIAKLEIILNEKSAFFHFNEIFNSEDNSKNNPLNTSTILDLIILLLLEKSQGENKQKLASRKKKLEDLLITYLKTNHSVDYSLNLGCRLNISPTTTSALDGGLFLISFLKTGRFSIEILHTLFSKSGEYSENYIKTYEEENSTILPASIILAIAEFAKSNGMLFFSLRLVKTYLRHCLKEQFFDLEKKITYTKDNKKFSATIATLLGSNSTNNTFSAPEILKLIESHNQKILLTLKSEVKSVEKISAQTKVNTDGKSGALKTLLTNMFSPQDNQLELEIECKENTCNILLKTSSPLVAKALDDISNILKEDSRISCEHTNSASATLRFQGDIKILRKILNRKEPSIKSKLPAENLKTLTQTLLKDCLLPNDGMFFNFDYARPESPTCEITLRFNDEKALKIIVDFLGASTASPVKFEILEANPPKIKLSGSLGDLSEFLQNDALKQRLAQSPARPAIKELPSNYSKWQVWLEKLFYFAREIEFKSSLDGESILVTLEGLRENSIHLQKYNKAKQDKSVERIKIADLATTTTRYLEILQTALSKKGCEVSLIENKELPTQTQLHIKLDKSPLDLKELEIENFYNFLKEMQSSLLEKAQGQKQEEGPRPEPELELELELEQGEERETLPSTEHLEDAEKALQELFKELLAEEKNSENKLTIEANDSQQAIDITYKARDFIKIKSTAKPEETSSEGIPQKPAPQPIFEISAEDFMDICQSAINDFYKKELCAKTDLTAGTGLTLQLKDINFSSDIATIKKNIEQKLQAQSSAQSNLNTGKGFSVIQKRPEPKGGLPKTKEAPVTETVYLSLETHEKIAKHLKETNATITQETSDMQKKLNLVLTTLELAPALLQEKPFKHTDTNLSALISIEKEKAIEDFNTIYNLAQQLIKTMDKIPTFKEGKIKILPLGKVAINMESEVKTALQTDYEQIIKIIKEYRPKLQKTSDTRSGYSKKTIKNPSKVHQGSGDSGRSNLLAGRNTTPTQPLTLFFEQIPVVPIPVVPVFFIPPAQVGTNSTNKMNHLAVSFTPGQSASQKPLSNSHNQTASHLPIPKH